MSQTELTDKELEGYAEARNFTKDLGKEIINDIRTGMTERDVEKVASEVFHANGVRQHWHMPIVGVSEGSTKLRSTYALTSSYLERYTRVLQENDIVLIDIAPVYNDYPADYTICHVFGSNPDLEALIAYARDVSCQVAGYAKRGMAASDLFRYAQELIDAKPEYKLAYPPLISMGHRLCRLPPAWQKLPEPGLSYLLLKVKGAFLSSGNHMPLSGLWVIEPYLMYKERAAKFEALVYVGEETVNLDRRG